MVAQCIGRDGCTQCPNISSMPALTTSSPSPPAYHQCHTPSDLMSSVSCSSNFPLLGAQCTIDVGPTTPCSFPLNTSTLAPGTHSITISSGTLSSTASFILQGRGEGRGRGGERRGEGRGGGGERRRGRGGGEREGRERGGVGEGEGRGRGGEGRGGEGRGGEGRGEGKVINIRHQATSRVPCPNNLKVTLINLSFDVAKMQGCKAKGSPCAPNPS